jgi:hypothetical protein
MWMRLALVFLSVAVIACSRVGQEPALPPEALSAAQPAAETQVAVGELLETKIYVIGVEAAAAAVAVCPAEDASAVRVRLHAESTGILALFKDGSMEQDTLLSLSQGVPLENQAYVELGSKWRHYDVRFAPGNFSYDYTRNFGAARRGRVKTPDGSWVHDLHSTVLFMRSLRPEPRYTAQIHAIMGRYLWRVTLRFVGTEVIQREDGPEPALRWDGVASRKRDNSDKVDERRFKVWFSDDPDRVPIRVLSESSFGDIRMETLRHARRGAEARCAELAVRKPSNGSGEPTADPNAAAPPGDGPAANGPALDGVASPGVPRSASGALTDD